MTISGRSEVTYPHTPLQRSGGPRSSGSFPPELLHAPAVILHIGSGATRATPYPDTALLLTGCARRTSGPRVEEYVRQTFQQNYYIERERERETQRNISLKIGVTEQKFVCVFVLVCF